MDLCAQMFSFSTSTSILCWRMPHIREACLATAAAIHASEEAVWGRRKVSDGFAEESGGGGQCCMCELERIV
jgi:hypothetical protein